MIAADNDISVKQVAVIVTEYRYNSHADMILGRLLGDLDYQPRVQVVSIYTDQVPANDMSREASERLGIPIYSTIREAIRAEHCDRPIDGVVLIGEHGRYPINEKEQMLYPRKRFLEETLNALDEMKLTVPIFSDKHLSYDNREALWMYRELKGRGIPFLGGSSIPHAPAVPGYDPQKLRTVKEILVISNSTLVEAYGFHALEVLQAVAEQRGGGETGVGAVEVIQGPEAWESMDRGEWPEDLMLEALKTFPGVSGQHPRALERDPIVMFIQYLDGTRGYVIQFRSLVEQWGFACRNREGEVAAALHASGLERPFRHFETFTRMIEDLVIAGVPPFPIERTLLTTILTNAAVDAWFFKSRMEWPELSVRYQA